MGMRGGEKEGEVCWRYNSLVVKESREYTGKVGVKIGGPNRLYEKQLTLGIGVSSEKVYCHRFYGDASGITYVEKGCHEKECFLCEARELETKVLLKETEFVERALWGQEFTRMVEEISGLRTVEREAEVVNVEQERVFAGLGGYPTSRHPHSYRHDLDENTADFVVKKWFHDSGIKLGSNVKNTELDLAMRTLYT
ncbi:hypothetical protein B9Z19DRAFT_1066729 [Tuber borchii]|uniref:Uncharacterized protein n=1 Tax=Tuber borchii TaxID=42251 RepID=A0A2T6ZLE4_TUBBO|nr:hypothetical protein B9Z19DRAFT_1066729 [Tuber borchii]